MKLSEIMTAAAVRIPLRSTTKEDVLGELVSLLPSASEDGAAEQILHAVLEREGRMSTGIGQGVAIPHGKTNLVTNMEITFGIAPTPIDFDSLDGNPVSIFFLLVSPPEMTGPHIKALAQISRMLCSDMVRDELSSASSSEDILRIFQREESLLPD